MHTYYVLLSGRLFPDWEYTNVKYLLIVTLFGMHNYTSESPPGGKADLLGQLVYCLAAVSISIIILLL